MALQAVSQAASFDQSGTYVLSLDQMVDAILLDDAQALNVFGMSSGAGEGAKVASQTKHEWDEDALNPVTVRGAAASLTSAATTLLISASEVTRVTAGTLIRDQLSGKTEVMQVTARSGVSATVTRAYGSHTAESHASGATYDIISHPRPEGMAGPKDESVARVRAFNYTQIFSKGVQLTGTAQAIIHNGLDSESAYQIDKRLRELMRELSRTIIMGIRSSTRHSDTVYGTMGGLIEYINYASGGNTNSTAETLTPTVLNAMIKQVWDDGGTPTHILVGGLQKQKISSFDKEYRRSTMDSRRSGFTVEEFVSDLGVIMPIVVDRWIPDDICLVVDRDRIAVIPLRGRAFFLEKLAKTGDSDNWQIVGEYTMEVKNAAKAHAIHTNLKR